MRFDKCLWLQKLQVPKEIVWLNGAPGSGKGVNTPYILESRGLTRAVSMSSLFQETPEIRQYMDRGELVPDTMVSLISKNQLSALCESSSFTSSCSAMLLAVLLSCGGRFKRTSLSVRA